MGEMIERVASAIENAGLAWKAKNVGDNCGWADIPSSVFARAAIEAMREPAEFMIAIGDHMGSANDEQFDRNMWRAMIDAALSSEQDR